MYGNQYIIILIQIAVTAVIALVCQNPKVARRPFLRDCIFLLAAGTCVFIITNDNKISIGEAIGMISIYLLYVLVVVLGEIVCIISNITDLMLIYGITLWIV